MKQSMKEILQSLLRFFVILLLGGMLLYLPLLTLLFARPPYIVRGLGLLAVTGIIVLALCLCGLLRSRGKRVVKLGYLALALGVAVYIGHGVWRDHIPTMDDRIQMLYEYQPHAPDTKAVRLEEEPVLKLEGWALPSMDGATALYPVYAAFAQAVYPERGYPLYDNGLVECTNTVNAYQRLIQRDVDVIFVAAPSQAQLEAAERAGMELHMTPIGREAFVFFVNSRNPVEGLTVDQIKGIYSGEITNWREVGGKNQSIRAFQRAENSGSQSALQRLMGDTPIMEPLREDVVADMGGIISQVASYRNYKNALGFSFRYYSTRMVENDQIRLLALNGVFPTRETIRDGSYPIANEFYAITAAPIGSPAPETRDQDLAALLDWIRSPQGQWIIDQTGYVSLAG